MLKLIKTLLGNSFKDNNDINSGKNNTIKNKKEEPPCALEIQMNVDGTINIICSWPEFDESNKKAMTFLANNYALMIDALNSGFLAKDIINTLKNHEHENPMDTLFAQNVFYKIAELTYLKQTQNSSNNALIKPSQVFHKPS
jgi:hypothetical protein